MIMKGLSFYFKKLKTRIKEISLGFLTIYGRIWYSLIVQGSVAQWLEQGTHKPKVVGSNPTRASYYYY